MINHDTLRGGPGDDVFRVRGILRDPGVLLPGGPHNRLHYAIRDKAAVDLAARTVKTNGRTVVTWRGGRIDHMVTGGYVPDALTFTGTEGADVLTLQHSANIGSPRVTADMGGGNDRVEAPFNGFADDSTFSAGRGYDTLLVNLTERHGQPALPRTDDVAIDLAAHSLHVETATVESDASAVITGFDRVRAGGWHSLVVRANEGANTVLAVGCRVHVDGRDGNDVLRTYHPRRCPPGKPHLDGGAGNDLLIGGELADVLVGGPGRDNANGRGGADTCRAEITRHCER